MRRGKFATSTLGAVIVLKFPEGRPKLKRFTGATRISRLIASQSEKTVEIRLLYRSPAMFSHSLHPWSVSVLRFAACERPVCGGGDGVQNVVDGRGTDFIEPVSCVRSPPVPAVGPTAAIRPIEASKAAVGYRPQYVDPSRPLCRFRQNVSQRSTR